MIHEVVCLNVFARFALNQNTTGYELNVQAANCVNSSFTICKNILVEVDVFKQKLSNRGTLVTRRISMLMKPC